MNKTRVLTVMVTVIVLAAAALAFFFRPQTVEAGLGQSLDGPLRVQLTPMDDTAPLVFSLAPDDDAFEELTALLESQRFRRAFVQPAQDTVSLDYMADLSFLDGTPSKLSFCGDRFLQFHAPEGLRAFTIAGLDSGKSRAFQEKLLDLLLHAAPNP